MTDFEARSRWSLSARCARAGAYALRGTEPGEPSDEMLGYWARGKQIGAWMVERFVAQYGAENIVAEKAVPWPAGILHTDIFVKPERLAVEVKSMSDPAVTDDHVMQLAGEVHFDPDAERGALVLVDPSSLRTRTVPVTLTEELVERVEAIADQVARAADPRAPLPERVCSRPSDAIGKGCPFAATCFADWERPDPIEIEGDVARLANVLVAEDAAVKRAKVLLARREERREGTRAALRQLIEPATEYVTAAGELAVAITRVKGRVSFSLTEAVKAGVWTPDDDERFAPFVKESAGYDRFNVKPVYVADEGDLAGSLVALAEDFGDVPF